MKPKSQITEFTCIKCEKLKPIQKIKSYKSGECQACYMNERLENEVKKEKHLESQRKHYHNNPIRKEATRLRMAIKLYSSERMVEEYGYTKEEFRKWIESQFRDGMSWENHGEVWEYDHIMNITQMLRAGYSERIINSLNNIRPLFIDENSSRKRK